MPISVFSVYSVAPPDRRITKSRRGVKSPFDRLSLELRRGTVKVRDGTPITPFPPLPFKTTGDLNNKRRAYPFRDRRVT